MPPDQLAIALNKFEPVSLADIQSVRLQDRQDTKFVFDRSLLPQILIDLDPIYKVLTIDSQCQLAYHNLYFDTENFQYYLDHHNRRFPRLKVRYRGYASNGDKFLELKAKNNKRRTQKIRLQIDKFTFPLLESAKRFIRENSTIDPDKISPSLEGKFERITLVNLASSTRITIDCDIVYIANNKQFPLQNLVVAEIKQDRYNPKSPFIKLMRERKIRPQKFSKYCMGMLQVHPHLKYNRFKSILLLLRQIGAITTDAPMLKKSIN